MRIGLDIGGTKIEAVALGTSLEIEQRLRRPTGYGNDAVLEITEAIIRELLERTGASPIEHLGIGIPGVVDAATGRVRHAVNLGITELDITAELTRRIGVTTRVENDVNAAAVGAWHLLHLQDSAAYLNLGTGLAAGIVVDGRPWRGAHGVAGEIGHIPVDPNGLACPCGQRGCLETVASGSGLARLWPSKSPLPSVELFDRADAADPEAVAIRDRFVSGICAAIRILLLTADVETVVIGGGLSRLGERLLVPIQDTLEDWGRSSAFFASLDATSRVRLLPSGTSAAAVGAALLGAGPQLVS